MMTKRSGSRIARLDGMLLLIRRQIRRYWFESLFVILSIALGAGVLTGTVQFLRFSDAATHNALTQSVRISTGRTAQFDQASQTPVVRLEPHSVEPITFHIDDILELRTTFAQIGRLLITDSAMMRIVTVGGKNDDIISAGMPSNEYFMVASVTPDSLIDPQHQLLAGRLLTWEDVEEGSRHIVLNEHVAGELFSHAPEQAVGRTISLQFGASGHAWTIVGVVANEGTADDWAQGYVPLDTVPGTAYGGAYRDFGVIPADGIKADELVRDLQAYYDNRYTPGQVDVRGPMTTDPTYIIAMLALAGIALLTAAITVLNLLTARILRRQRSIGTSIALGATSRMLFWQTAGEAALLGTGGGVLGLLISKGFGALLGSFFTSGTSFSVDAAAWGALRVNSADVMTALAMGIAVSLVFALYPAWLATQQMPAEALRTE